jgi:hypothetical protein
MCTVFLIIQVLTRARLSNDSLMNMGLRSLTLAQRLSW